MVVRHVRKAAIAVVGAAVLAAGVALLVLPGPGFLVIAAGFAILATEFDWAQRALERTRERAIAAMEQATSNVWGSALSLATAAGMVAAGVVLISQPDWPFGGVWTGASIILGGLILLATTIYAIRTPGTGHYPPDPELGLDPHLASEETPG